MVAILIPILLLLYSLGVLIAFIMFASLVHNRHMWIDPVYILYSWLFVIVIWQEYYRDRDI